MSGERRLQEAAISADMGKSGKQLRIVSSLLRPVQEPLHRVERTALIHLKLGIEVVCNRQFWIEPQSCLKGFIGGMQAFRRTQIVLVPKPAGSAQSGPCRCVRGIHLHTAFIPLDGRRQILPLPAQLVRTKIKLIDRGARRPILLESLMLAEAERGEGWTRPHVVPGRHEAGEAREWLPGKSATRPESRWVPRPAGL